MKETEQTLLDQIKDQVAKDHGMDTCAFALNVYAKSDARRIDLMIDEIAERYAEAKAKASCEATLKNASDNAVVRGYCAGCERAGLLHCAHADSCGSNVVIVDKSSINHPSNIVIL